MNNKLAVYAFIDIKGVEYKIALGLGTVKNGSLTFDLADIIPVTSFEDVAKETDG